jgi:hypothetical protein
VQGPIEQNGPVKKLIWLVLSLAIVVVLYSCLVFIQGKPVLLHALAETGCACGEYHEDVTGLVVFNPFRNRSPERSAEQFFEELRSGECIAATSLCQYALNGHRVSEWRLANARKVGDGQFLYYKLTKMDSPNRLTGEGTVKVMRAQNKWTVVYYSSYF